MKLYALNSDPALKRLRECDSTEHARAVTLLRKMEYTTEGLTYEDLLPEHFAVN